MNLNLAPYRACPRDVAIADLTLRKLIAKPATEVPPPKPPSDAPWRLQLLALPLYFATGGDAPISGRQIAGRPLVSELP
jgi:hypothetical protein